MDTPIVTYAVALKSASAAGGNPDGNGRSAVHGDAYSPGCGDGDCRPGGKRHGHRRAHPYPGRRPAAYPAGGRARARFCSLLPGPCLPARGL